MQTLCHRIVSTREAIKPSMHTRSMQETISLTDNRKSRQRVWSSKSDENLNTREFFPLTQKRKLLFSSLIRSSHRKASLSYQHTQHRLVEGCEALTRQHVNSHFVIPALVSCSPCVCLTCHIMSCILHAAKRVAKNAQSSAVKNELSSALHIVFDFGMMNTLHAADGNALSSWRFWCRMLSADYRLAQLGFCGDARWLVEVAVFLVTDWQHRCGEMVMRFWWCEFIIF